jgi:hypothetical protein
LLFFFVFVSSISVSEHRRTVLLATFLGTVFDAMATLTFNGWFRLPTTATGIKAELEVKVRVFLQQMYHPSLLLR